MNNLQLLTNSLFIFVISPDKLKQQGLIYRANAAFMLQGEPLEMQHVAQLGCQRFTTQQTGPEVERRPCRHTRKHTFKFYTFNHAYKLHKTTYDPNTQLPPQPLRHRQLQTSDHNRADWVTGVGLGCGKDGCAVEQQLEGDKERKWVMTKAGCTQTCTQRRK